LNVVEMNCENADESPESTSSLAELKVVQSSKIREIGDALVAAGFHTLDEQAKVLGLSRSTTWTLLKGHHKGSGVSAKLISQMLAAPGLPRQVRAKIYQYIEDKIAGRYGDSKVKRRRFAASLARRDVDHAFDDVQHKASPRRKTG
jgi:hypothetical protein